MTWDGVVAIIGSFLLIAFGIVVWQLHRIRLALDRREGTTSKAGENSTTAEEQTKNTKLVVSPLKGLSFSQALSLIPLWDGIQRSSQEMVRSEFAARFGDGVVAATNAIQFIQSTGEYVIEFSQRGRQMLEIGQATLMKSKETGRMIPKLIGIDGKIIETGKEVGKLKTVMGKVASLSSMIVGAAHIISGADVAKKVGVVSRDVKFLIDARQNSQMARLESIFHAAQQILAAPLTEHAEWEIRRLMRQIAEIRATWRRDLETKLHHVNDPNSAGFFQAYFRTQSSKDMQVVGGISEGQEDLALVEIAMVLQIALAEPIGDSAVFFEHGLPSELHLLRRTAELLEHKAKFISGQSPDVHVEPMIAAMKDLNARMTVLTSAEQGDVPVLPSQN